MEFEVALDNHHLDELKAKPITGLLELIWNALDAEADWVEISFGRNALGGIEDIRVADNGHGMTVAEAHRAFAALGASWKLTAARSRSGERVLHGKHGRGRFLAAGIGRAIKWETVAEDDGERKLTTIVIRDDNLRRGEISDPISTEADIGTKVVISGITEHPEGISETAADRLVARLAIYIEEYHPTVIYDGEVLNPASIQEKRTDYELEDDNARLDVIEWTRPVDRALYLCTPDGMALDHISPGIQAPGFEFTAYLRWTGFEDQQRILAPELDAESAAVIEAGRGTLRTHFRDRAEDERRTQVAEWKVEEVYPYEGEPDDTTEEATRDLFDVVAVTARDAVNAGSLQNRRFSLSLLRQAIEQDPGSLRRVLKEVLELPVDRLEELDELLRQATLASVISASRSITNRLDFIKALDEMVLNPAIKKRVLERSQLHRILAGETWVFGEQFALTADDESLRSALKRHIRILGRDDLAPEEAEARVPDPGNRKDSIVDLMLARSVPQGTKTREHLVLEFKRPSVPIGPTEAQQIREYAIAVARDDRFTKADVQWDFIAVSTKLTGTVIEDARQSQLPTGQLNSYEDGRVRVWARTWSEVLEDAAHRLKYVKERLGYDPSAQQAFKYLREKHADFVPAEIATSGDVVDQTGRAIPMGDVAGDGSETEGP